jgi:hypothetical protein
MNAFAFAIISRDYHRKRAFGVFLERSALTASRQESTLTVFRHVVDVLCPDSSWITRHPEVGRLQSAVAMSSLTILELAVGASGPTTGASFSILKA